MAEIWRDLIDRARNAVSRPRRTAGHEPDAASRRAAQVLHAFSAAIAVGMCVAYAFNERLRHIIFKPLLEMGTAGEHPASDRRPELRHQDGALRRHSAGCAVGALPGVAVHLAGLYVHEKRYVVPFMAATVGLFFTGAFLAYRLCAAGGDAGAARTGRTTSARTFTPTITIEDYMNFFFSVILGLGITFELPIVIFFLATFGIVDAGFLWRNGRYAILHHLHRLGGHLPAARTRSACASSLRRCCCCTASASAWRMQYIRSGKKTNWRSPNSLGVCNAQTQDNAVVLDRSAGLRLRSACTDDKQVQRRTRHAVHARDRRLWPAL